MEKVENGDFIELDYTGKIKDSEIVFDTTDPKLAKESGIGESKGPIIAIIGQGQLIKGLDEQIIGKEIGKEYDFEITSLEAFGKKDAKMIRLMNINAFKKEDITPVPGLQVTVDDSIGIVKIVSGGRVIVDFNHPLSGKDVTYNVKLIKKLTDDKEKVEHYLKIMMGLSKKECDLSLEDGNAKIVIKKKIELNDEIKKLLIEKIKKAIPSIKKITLEVKP